MPNVPVLEMRNIAKVFGKFYALKGVDLTVWPGEIHALMGENGAGKSTLMKILAGAYSATSGEILIDGTPHTIRGPKDALGAGITLIYQEMQLAPNLTVAENIFLGSEIARGGLVQRKTMAAQAQAVIDRLGANFSATDRVMKLTIAEQQQVEIARALHRNSRILVMDEPTAALSSRETHRLFELIMRLRDEGMAIIYISHRMAEVYELSDRVSVLRDGQYVGSLTRDSLNAAELVRMMVGRPLSDLFNKARDITPGKPRLTVHHLTDGGKIQPVSLQVRAGELAVVELHRGQGGAAPVTVVQITMREARIAEQRRTEVALPATAFQPLAFLQRRGQPVRTGHRALVELEAVHVQARKVAVVEDAAFEDGGTRMRGDDRLHARAGDGVVAENGGGHAGILGDVRRVRES